MFWMRRLAALVRRESCAEVALDWGIGAHVRLGDGEAQTGGRAKAAILADVCEAVIGAAFLDAQAHTTPSPVDGLHLDAASHAALGKAIAAALRAL